MSTFMSDVFGVSGRLILNQAMDSFYPGDPTTDTVEQRHFGAQAGAGWVIMDYKTDRVVWEEDQTRLAESHAPQWQECYLLQGVEM